MFIFENNYTTMELEQLRAKFNNKFPNSNMEIIKKVDVKRRNILIVLTSFGLVKVDFFHLLSGKVPSIKTALNKTEYFINKSKLVHNNKYAYNDTIYINSRMKITINCVFHGNFIQEANSHLQGIGCPLCKKDKLSTNPTGWSISNWEQRFVSDKFDSFKVYIIKCWNKDECFYKIGRTSQKVKIRFYGKKVMPYSYETIKEFIGEAKEMYKLEQELKNKNKNNKYYPKISFGGETECFTKINNK